ncbi:hypothetical protein WNZ14_15430 [Hoeflea sp. AS60]|uniref:hypothetical protein n=1 Tax=Hoeflea sp. AS60 TaxID=3135780 RepID=UPI00317B5695
MNKPNDPISVRQARQGKPVLVILAISLVLAVFAGFVLWGVVAEEPQPDVIGANTPAVQHVSPENALVG